MEFDQPVQNLVWKFFIENSIIQSLAQRMSPTKGKNMVITGFPSLDPLLKQDYKPKNVWKHNQPIKIIWAPHHTINASGALHFASFLQYADIMINIAEKYRDKIQIAFKPHPLLCYFFNTYLPGKLFGFGVKAQFKIFRKIIVATILMAFTTMSVIYFIDNELIKLIAGCVLGVITYYAYAKILKISELAEIEKIVINFVKSGKL